MSRVLIVEDSPTQAVQIEMMLADAGFETASVTDGVEALRAVAEQPPEIILTDLHMPNMNGLQLVEAIREQYDHIPVILMTADGTESTAVTALRKGAAHYIPKKFIESTLLPTVNDVLGMLKQQQSRVAVFSALVDANSTFVFGNESEIVAPMIQHIEQQLRSMHYTDKTGLMRLNLAVQEALVNAIDHGNLELDSELRDEHGEQYVQIGLDRRNQKPYSERRVTLTVNIVPQRVTFVIRDEGPGFDPAKVPDPTDPENLLRAHGRGLMLIQSVMDEVRHNKAGNEITMIKERDRFIEESA